MFNLFKKNNQSSEETEFIFIWYKKMMNGNSTHYTAPFRTKVKAKTIEEAVNKLKTFALSKMTLCVVEEKDFNNKDELKNLQNTFDELSKKMESYFNKTKNI